jgi:hypothetical protein
MDNGKVQINVALPSNAMLEVRREGSAIFWTDIPNVFGVYKLTAIFNMLIHEVKK